MEGLNHGVATIHLDLPDSRLGHELLNIGEVTW